MRALTPHICYTQVILLVSYISDYYYRLGRPLVGALTVQPYSTTELQNLFAVTNQTARVRFENVIAWLESHGHIRWQANLWHANSRVNLAVLADGLGYDYGVSVGEMRSRKPFGPHVRARAHFSAYAKLHGWSFAEIGRFLGRDAEFARNAAERYALKEAA